MNTDIFRASKNVLVNDTSLLIKNAEKKKKNSAANDLGIFQKTNKKGMSVENFRSAISSQLSGVALKDWSEESKNPAVVNKILVGLKKSL